jgi:hypothetical protein
MCGLSNHILVWDVDSDVIHSVKIEMVYDCQFPSRVSERVDDCFYHCAFEIRDRDPKNGRPNDAFAKRRNIWQTQIPERATD